MQTYQTFQAQGRHILCVVKGKDLNEIPSAYINRLTNRIKANELKFIEVKKY